MVSIVWVIVIIFIVLLFLAGVGLGLFFLIRYLNRELEPANLPIVISFPTHRSGGYALGLEKGTRWDENGRGICNVIPKDIEYDVDGNPVYGKEIEIPIKKGMRLDLGKGSWSSRRQMVIYLPEYADQMPEGLKKTPIGLGMKHGIEALRIYDDILESYRAGDEARAETMKQLALGTISDEWRKHIEAMAKSAINLVKEERKKDRDIDGDKKKEKDE